jgi:hypothetical protein
MNRIVTVCLCLLLFIGGSIGWVRNVVAIAYADYSDINEEKLAMIVVRVFGVGIVPVGAVVGWIPQQWPH